MRDNLTGPTPFIAGAGLAAVVALAILVATDVSRPFDAAVIDVVRSPALLDPFAPLRVITQLGSTSAVTVVALLAIVIGVAVGPWRHGVIGAGVIGLTSLGNSLLKAFIARQRPDLLEPIVQEHGFSFPSGHAILGMTAFGVLAVLISRTRLPRWVRTTLVAAMVALVLLIGVSRVYLGVHYPTDVIAGWTLGAVIVLLYERFTRTVSMEPAAAAVDVDPATRRSDRPGAG